MRENQPMQQNNHFEKLRFRQSVTLSKRIYDMMDGGKKIFSQEGIDLIWIEIWKGNCRTTAKEKSRRTAAILSTVTTLMPICSPRPKPSVARPPTPTVRVLPTLRSASWLLRSRCQAGNIMTVPVRFLLCFRIPKVFIKATQRKEPFYWLQRRKIWLVCKLLSGCILRRWML